LLIIIYFFRFSKSSSSSGNNSNNNNHSGYGGGGGELSETSYKQFQLISRTPLSSNTYRFRFKLSNSTSKLGLPIGKHMLLRTADGTISRPYTPTTNDTERGYFDLVIKVYPLGKMGPLFGEISY